MIETVASVGLPIDEKLMIQKNRLVPEGGLKGGEKRISIVTGTHGDELEGQYVCYELQRRIKENIGCLTGIVDVYPAINPLGIDSITRGIPGFDLDMNRIFPGSQDGSMPEYIASKIIGDLSGSAAVIDIHASNIFLEEIPQVRINELSRDVLVPLAKLLNIDYIWVHSSATVLESTLAYSLNVIGTPTLVVEMGVGMRITKNFGDQLVDGIFALMKKLGIWSGEGADNLGGRRGFVYQRRKIGRVHPLRGALEKRQKGRSYRRYPKSADGGYQRADLCSHRRNRVYSPRISNCVRGLAYCEDPRVRRL